MILYPRTSAGCCQETSVVINQSDITSGQLFENQDIMQLAEIVLHFIFL